MNTGDFNEDGLKFNTLFDSKVKKNEAGWSAEVIIPYSALRFPNKKNHNWGINFGRNIKDFEEMYVWSPVDERILKFYQTMGLVKNIKDIKPPTRLFFYPYLQSSINFQKNLKPSSSYSAGLDLKYGISNSFTLDATLIPDFGQVTFDDENSNTIREHLQHYVDGDIDSMMSIIADDAEIYINSQESVSASDVRAIHELEHSIFDGISTSWSQEEGGEDIGAWVESTNYPAGPANEPASVTQAWFTWNGTSISTGDSLTIPVHVVYSWNDEDQVQTIYQFFDSINATAVIEASIAATSE